MSGVYDFHGCAVRLICGDTAAAAALAADFSAFAAPGAEPLITVEARLEAVRRADLPPALLSTPRWSVLAARPGRRLVWYPEGAAAACDYAARRAVVRAGDRELLRELAYLLVLSRAGEELDRRGLHRLHAGALARRGAALLFCGHRGAGKTTLLLELLKDPSFSLLSDDTPLVDRRARVLPFPVRIGLGLDSPHLPGFPGLPRLSRRRFSPKALLEIGRSGFPVSGAAPAGEVFLLRRAAAPAVRPAGPAAGAAELAVSLAAGYGVPQLAEFFLRPHPGDAASKAGILASRAAAAAALLRRASFSYLDVCGDHARNAAALKAYLNSGSARA